MTDKEWIDNRLMKDDLEYLQRRGFDTRLVPNDNPRFNVEYMTHITKGNDVEIISTPYQLEQVVKVLKMAENKVKGKTNL